MLDTNTRALEFPSLNNDSYFDQISCFVKNLFYCKEHKMQNEASPDIFKDIFIHIVSIDEC